MADAPVRVLLVEDDPDDHLLIREWLAESQGTRFQMEWAASYETALEALGRGTFDACLLDYRLGRHDGLELLREARKLGWQGPLILLTGQEDREVDLGAMQAGAADYLVKGQIGPALLERAIRYALERHQMVAELDARVRERTAELARANAALAEADRRKDEFLAMLAHELRNPLAPIRNALHVLRARCAGDPVLTDLGAMMSRQLGHVTRLVEDLLDVSRITHGKIELRREAVDLAEVVKRTVEDVRPFVEERHHRLEVGLPREPLWLEADPARLEQVLVNLLHNAAKYTPPGGRVRLTAGREAGEAVVRVRDNGIGIRADMLQEIFDVFRQADRIPGRVSEGLGLGLGLVSKLVELHGGSVRACSDGPGQGSEFVVRLPALSESDSEARTRKAGQGQRTGRPLRLLVTDDNADAAESLAMLLGALGHTVRVTNDGPSALEAARAFRPEVVLLDIGLPGMDGYEVARRLRRDPEMDGAILVAMTGYGQPDDVERSRSAGFDHHLVKPADPAELQQLLADSGHGRAP